MLTTPFTSRFAILHPIIQAGMATNSGATLAATVSNAGAMGSIGSVGGSPRALLSEVARCRDLTAAPFSINVVTFDWGGPWREVIDAAIQARPPSLTISFGDPIPVLRRAQEAGIPAIVQAQDVATAIAAIDAGVDGLIVQGNEAGGHTGRRGTLSFAAQVLAMAGDIPVAVAGGIGDGRGLAGVLAMGAGAAVMGTRFKATPEFGPMPNHDAEQKAAIVASNGDNTVYDEINDIAIDRDWPNNVAGRMLANRFTATWLGRREELRREVKAAGRNSEWTVANNREPDTALNWAGESSALVHAVEPAAAIIERTIREAEAHLRAVARLFAETS